MQDVAWAEIIVCHTSEDSLHGGRGGAEPTSASRTGRDWRVAARALMDGSSPGDIFARYHQAARKWRRVDLVPFEPPVRAAWLNHLFSAGRAAYERRQDRRVGRWQSFYWIVSEKDALWAADPAVADTVTLPVPVGVCCMADPPPHPASCVAASPPSKKIMSIKTRDSTPELSNRRRPRRVTRSPKLITSPALQMRFEDGRMPLPKSL